MKKILTAICVITAIVLMSPSSNAQSDSFFKNWKDVGNGLDDIDNVELPPLPGGHGNSGDVNAPLGTGLLILISLSAGYTLHKKLTKDN